MKNILIVVLFLTACFYCHTAVSQQIKKAHNDFPGEMVLTVDVSEMKDTVGRFMITVGGEIFYPEIKNNILTINKLMQEPRKTSLSFFPAQKIKANPGMPLNEIAAEISDKLFFLGESSKFKIVVKGNVSNNEIINASPQQKKYAALIKLKENFDAKIIEDYAALIRDIENEKDKRVKDSLISVYYKYYREKYSKYYQDTILGFVKYNPDASASLFELEEYSVARYKDLKTLSLLYNNLTERLKMFPTGRRVFNSIDQESFADSNLAGKLAPNFIQNDSLGNAFSLKDFKGHVTLLEFWASWCGPCRGANPALVKAYYKYSGKGFRILGVSLDDNKERWLDAIKNDGLPWNHVSDLKGFGNSAAELYHITSIPSNFLIDESGKIIASNLEEKELNGYLEKLLK